MSMLVFESVADARCKELGLAKPYVDPLLFRHPDHYADLLRRVDAAGMLRFRPRSDCEQPSVGVFFVTKNDGSIRMALDTRITKFAFVELAGTKLPTGASRAGLEISSGANGYMVAADAQCAFHRMELPSDLAHAFTQLNIVNRALRPGGLELDVDVFPEILVPPIRWNWALHVCRDALTNIAWDAGAHVHRLIFGGARPPMLGRTDNWVVAACVDNFCVAAGSSELADNVDQGDLDCWRAPPPARADVNDPSGLEFNGVRGTTRVARASEVLAGPRGADDFEGALSVGSEPPGFAEVPEDMSKEPDWRPSRAMALARRRVGPQLSPSELTAWRPSCSVAAAPADASAKPIAALARRLSSICLLDGVDVVARAGDRRDHDGLPGAPGPDACDASSARVAMAAVRHLAPSLGPEGFWGFLAVMILGRHRLKVPVMAELMTEGASSGAAPAGRQAAGTVGGRTALARRTAGKSTVGTSSGRKGADGGILKFYTDDSAGLKVGPTTVLVLSLVFMAIVCSLHILGKFRGS
ncbi:unnamed protein product [Prorocentrum cordatum]|uniref:Protein transport protein Sec61 subunit beta n=1 Tax=Prorocentrum cordatum TaxID=2364126 RepID=A0ABN9P780_9DINO|nr:unnamed protein product [Polarella glacialis]